MAPKTTKTRPTGFVKSYLFTYNLFSTLSWSYLLFLTLQHSLSRSPSTVLSPLIFKHDVGPLHRRLIRTYAAVSPVVAYVQTTAVLEVIHVLLGWVRSPLSTTVMQVSSRLFLVWGITEQFRSAQINAFYASMILAWSITEVIRYAFYAFSLLGTEPYVLTYLRYTTFYVLYPLGAGSEAFLIASTVPSWASFGQGRWTFWAYGRMAMFLIWWPGLYVMYTHMMVQRRKVLSGATPSKVSKAGTKQA
ncbi:hypothetical protein AX15_003844 [Amanita polypyramis BW_CC]|nr:hypothetical protein AX15_003844 [Amanita polypyramis BW_CC]